MFRSEAVPLKIVKLSVDPSIKLENFQYDFRVPEISFLIGFFFSQNTVNCNTLYTIDDSTNKRFTMCVIMDVVMPTTVSRVIHFGVLMVLNGGGGSGFLFKIENRDR